MDFEGGVVFELRRPAPQVVTWQELGEEFLQQVRRPDLVQLVVTDHYEQAVGGWQQHTPWEFGDEAAAVYVADKVDGTRAGAKTIVLDERAVVVAAAGALAFGSDVARWMLRHEAQHVRLHQDDSAAWGVHRRSGQRIVSSRPWEFVWSAQSALDEYRCESAVHAQLSPLQPTYNPADARGIIRRLREARTIWTERDDLDHAYEVVVQALDRLVVIAAYTAAAVRAGHDTRQRWAEIPQLEPIWACLWRTPTLDSPISHAELWRHTLDISAAADHVLRGAGVELTFTNDQRALYFR